MRVHDRSRQRFPLRAVLCLLLLLFAGPGLAAQLNFQVLYQGIFSAGSKLQIADLSLSERRPAAAPYHESELRVTSQAYDYVEALYPIRYRFRSWYLDDHSTGLVSEYFEQNRREGIRHRLIYLTDPEQPFVTRDLVEEGEADLPDLLAGDYRFVLSDSHEARFDRLGLLAHVRAQALAPGTFLQAKVSNGKKMLTYRVRVEKREQIQAAGRNWKALKLRFDGVGVDKHGREKHAHRPVFIWLSDDPQHTPLRAVSRHVLGRFSIELRSIDQTPRLVMRGL